ncbi:uncharacterized protein [Antedon mediterranea]|uniref:uncharacterized protein n=1 Tax=Antedon mediterranea TaxID=105859 RepID=UPI003AF7B484
MESARLQIIVSVKTSTLEMLVTIVMNVGRTLMDVLIYVLTTTVDLNAVASLDMNSQCLLNACPFVSLSARTTASVQDLTTASAPKDMMEVDVKMMWMNANSTMPGANIFVKTFLEALDVIVQMDILGQLTAQISMNALSQAVTFVQIHKVVLSAFVTQDMKPTIHTTVKILMNVALV